MTKILLAIQDAFIIFAGCFVFWYLEKVLFFFSSYTHHHIYGPYELMARISLMEAIISFIPCYLVYLISMRIYNSTKLFFILSWAVNAIIMFFNFTGARIGGLTLRAAGHVLYDKGIATAQGVLFEVISPISIMSLYATFLFLKPYYQRRNIK